MNEFIKMATIFVENTYEITLDELISTESEEVCDWCLSPDSQRQVHSLRKMLRYKPAPWRQWIAVSR